MKKLIYVSFFLFYSISNLCAQGNIRGLVTDENGYSLPGAYISLEKTNFKTVTNIDGLYEIYGIPEDSYKLIVSYIGYSDYTQVVLHAEKYKID